MNAEELEQRLREFSPSNDYLKHPNGMTYTNGILYIINSWDLRWLVDAIASYQLTPIIAKDPDLIHWQSWKLVNTGKPNLYCFKNDLQQTQPTISKPLYRNHFPLESLQLYVFEGCLMLPSETRFS